MGKEDDFTKLVSKYAANEDFDQKERSDIGAFAKKNKLSNLNINLSYARAAVDFVQQKIKVAANHDMYQTGSYDNTFLTTGRLDPTKFQPADKCVNVDLRDNDDWRDASNTSSGSRRQRLDNIQKLNSMARNVQCGNCKEQAAVAYTFLHRLRVHPLDYVSLTPYSLQVDHVFVVIGREYNYDPRIKTDPWEQWGDGAVICDPWAPGLLRPSGTTPTSGKPFGETFAVYPAAQLRTKMKQLFPGFSGVSLEYGEA